MLYPRSLWPQSRPANLQLHKSRLSGNVYIYTAFAITNNFFVWTGILRWFREFLNYAPFLFYIYEPIAKFGFSRPRAMGWGRKRHGALEVRASICSKLWTLESHQLELFDLVPKRSSSLLMPHWSGFGPDGTIGRKIAYHIHMRNIALKITCMGNCLCSTSVYVQTHQSQRIRASDSNPSALQSHGLRTSTSIFQLAGHHNGGPDGACMHRTTIK
ncbi:hypothetical protein DFH27DRAFT_289562 [Peziza echinospora]|nr:hypothetical protein DFH27DRAFT_289562 [Peziza echinospora]